jgi:tRNA (cytidine/uridine-2'-O-)-methyltransferase
MKKLRLVLVAPRIAGNVGNVARTCLAVDAELHLVKPFGFIDDPKKLKRSSVGYWDDIRSVIYRDAEEFWQKFVFDSETAFYWATKRGSQIYYEQKYAADSVLIFGNEEEGVHESFWKNKGLANIQACRIPTSSVRCLNLGVSVAIFSFEVLRQWGKSFPFEQETVIS